MKINRKKCKAIFTWTKMSKMIFLNKLKGLKKWKKLKNLSQQ